MFNTGYVMKVRCNKSVQGWIEVLKAVIKNSTVFWCSRPNLEDAMCFILNILGSGKLILSLIVSISVNEVFRTSRRL
jgi:hypothetical protein